MTAPMPSPIRRRPPLPPPSLGTICDALKPFAQWVVWDALCDEREAPDSTGGVSLAGSSAPVWCSVPIDPVTGESVSSSGSGGTAVTAVVGAPFEAALRAFAGGAYQGIGFVLREDDPFSVVSLEEAIATDGT